MSLERRQQANARQSAAAKYAERKRQAYMEQQRNRREDRLEEMRRMMVIAATSQDGTSTLQGPEPGEDDSAETVCKDEQEQQPSSSTPCRVGKSTAVGPASASVSDQKQDADIEMSQRPRSTIRRAQRSRPKPRGRACGEQLVRQLQMPEWMVDVPPDLGQRWFVLPRPFGCRCLVVAARGNTRSWSRTGAPLHSFASHLPNGSRPTAGPQDHFCMLDCVYHEADSTYYITDVLAWNGQLLADCSVEFRMYWMHAKLSELADSQALPTLSQSHRFAAVPVWRCGGGGLACAYSSPVPYERDGLLLLHEDAHHLPGRSPLRLLWKDGHISRYLLDTDKHGMVPEQQAVVLQFCADGTVATSDEPPLALGSLPQQFQDSLHAKLHPGFLLRFRVMPGGLRWDSSGQPAGAHMVFDGVPNQRRGGADCFSKILFQYCARSQQLIAIQHLLQAAEDIAEGGSSAMDMLRPQAALATEDSASGTQDHDMAP